jgi:hypothetical protein
MATPPLTNQLPPRHNKINPTTVRMALKITSTINSQRGIV